MIARQRYTVEALRAQMVDVSRRGDNPEIELIPGEVSVHLRKGASSFGLVWSHDLGSLPVIGDGFWITIERDVP